MQIKTLLLAAAAGSGVLATWINKPLQGYPWGIGPCLNDAQTMWIVQNFKSILTNPDRKAAAKKAGVLLDDSYTETSDSINVLAGEPVSHVSITTTIIACLTQIQQGAVSFGSKQAFIDGVTGAPAIPVMNDLDIFHDCNKIAWQWLVDNLAMDVSPVKGFNKITVDPRTGVVKSNDIEFNSIAWGRDLGWTCSAPPAQGH